MTIEKLPSGSYRVRQSYNGTRYSVTLDHKPSKAEAMQAISEVMDDVPRKGTFYEYALKYIGNRENVISGATTSGYNSIIRAISKRFKDTPISNITRDLIQSETNIYAKNHAPKSVGNFHGFIASVLREYRPRLDTRSTLPQISEKPMRIPSDTEVAGVLKLAEGTEYEVPLLLAARGLRRSEIAALDIKDLSEDNILTINKAKVRNSSGSGYYIKNYGKTSKSNRRIYIEDYTADLIRKQGYIYQGGINSILYNLNKYQEKLGIEHFTLHSLRHYFASASHDNKIPSVVTQAEGGWKTDYIMKRIYTHSMQTNEQARERAKQLSERIKKALE